MYRRANFLRDCNMDQATFRKMKFLFEPVETIDKFDEWCQYWVGVEFPWDTVDPDSTSSPLKAMWAVYQYMLTGKNQSTHIVAASRNSQKTLISAGIHCFSMLQFRRDDAHTAATLNQSAAATKYLGNFMDNISRKLDMSSYISVKNFRSLELINLPQTDFAKKSHAKAKIVTASLKGANSDRASTMIFDEVDLTAQTILDEAIFIADPSVPRYDDFQIPACFIYLSSRKTNTGPMQKLMTRAEKEPQYDKLHKWSSSDFLRNCPPEIHKPEEERVMAYVSTTSLETFWGTEDFEKVVPENARGEWKPIHAYAGCRTCPVWIPCLSYSAKQRGDSPSLRTREFTHGLLRNVSDPNYIIAQSLNWQAESKGLIYKGFSRYKHLKDPISFYEWAVGESYVPEHLTKEEYGELLEEAQNEYAFRMLLPTKEATYVAMKKVGWEFNIGADWGGVDPATAHVVGYHRKWKRACTLHYEQQPMANHLWAQYIEENIAPVFHPELICPDLAAGADVSASYFKKYSTFNEKFHIEPGVSFIRGLLWNPIRGSIDYAIYDDSLSNQENNNLVVVDMFEHWQHVRLANGDVDTNRFNDDDYCHAGDSLRYALAPHIKDSRISVSSAQEPHLEVSRFKPPTPAEVKMMQDAAKMQSVIQTHFIQAAGVDVLQKPKDPNAPRKGGKVKFSF